MNKVQIINQGKNYTHASAGNISAKLIYIYL